MRVEVNNIPEYAEGYQYILATVTNEELWFYGAFHDLREAHRIAEMVSPAVVLINEDYKNDNQ